MESEVKDELISRIDGMEKCLKTYPSYKAITSKLDGACFNYTIKVEKMECILRKEQDKFEEWIKEKIAYYETKDDELLYTPDEIIINFYDCLKEYQRLKEKGENLKMTEDISWIYKRINELDKEITEAYREKSRLNRLLREKTTLDGYFSTEQVDTYYR